MLLLYICSSQRCQIRVWHLRLLCNAHVLCAAFSCPPESLASPSEVLLGWELCEMAARAAQGALGRWDPDLCLQRGALSLMIIKLLVVQRVSVCTRGVMEVCGQTGLTHSTVNSKIFVNQCLKLKNYTRCKLEGN